MLWFVSSAIAVTSRGGGGTPLFGLYGDVPLDRVCFFRLAVLNRVYNLTCLCPKTGSESVLNRVWYYEPRNFNPEQSLSFPSLREIRLKENAIERRTTRSAFPVLICIISTELNRLLPGHYNVINQHQII